MLFCVIFLFIDSFFFSEDDILTCYSKSSKDKTINGEAMLKKNVLFKHKSLNGTTFVSNKKINKVKKLKIRIFSKSKLTSERAYCV